MLDFRLNLPHVHEFSCSIPFERKKTPLRFSFHFQCLKDYVPFELDYVQSHCIIVCLFERDTTAEEYLSQYPNSSIIVKLTTLPVRYNGITHYFTQMVRTIVTFIRGFHFHMSFSLAILNFSSWCPASLASPSPLLCPHPISLDVVRA